MPSVFLLRNHLPPSAYSCFVVCYAVGSRSESPSQDSSCYNGSPQHKLILWRSLTSLYRCCHIRLAKTVSPLSTVSCYLLTLLQKVLQLLTHFGIFGKAFFMRPVKLHFCKSFSDFFSL